MIKGRIVAAVMALGMLTFGPLKAQDQLSKQTVLVQETGKANFHVDGNCGMCKKRIEKAVGDIEGVQSVNWDVKTKELSVVFDASKVKEKEIHEKIASVGHDTEEVKASDAVYKNLPGCCRYERNTK